MLTDIIREEGQNTGGNKTILYAPVEDFLTIPTATDRLITQPVTFKDGKGWLTINCSEETRNYTEEEQKSEQGSIYRVAVSGFLRGDSTAKRVTLDLMGYMRFIVLVEDNNSILRLVGNFFEQLEIGSSFTTGTGVSHLRGYQVAFSGDFTLPVPIYNPAL